VDRVASTELGNVGRFNGSSSYTYVSNNAIVDPTGQFSLDVWFSHDGPASNWEVLANKGDGWGTYAIFLNSDYVYVGMRNSDGQEIYVVFNGKFDGDLHHLAMTYDESDINVYFDGKLMGTETIGSDIWHDGVNLRLGSYAVYTTALFKGDIDQFRMWSDVLTASEVDALYKEQEACTHSDNLAAAGVASATVAYNQAYRADKVIDGQVEETTSSFSYWLTPDYTNGHVQVARTGRFGLTKVRFLNTHNASWLDRASSKYKIWASPNGLFAGEETEVTSGTGFIEQTGSWTSYTLNDPIEAKVIRFEILDYDGYGGGLNELQFFGLE
jgi:hypothetical protein